MKPIPGIGLKWVGIGEPASPAEDSAGRATRLKHRSTAHGSVDTCASLFAV